MPSLAATSFSAGVDEKLAIIDVYAQEGLGVLNNLIDSFTGGLSDSLAALVPPSVSAAVNNAQSTLLMVNKLGEVALNPDAILKSVIATSPELVSAIKTLPEMVQSGVTAVSGVISNIQTTIGGVTSFIKNADITTAAGLGNLVVGLTGQQLPFKFEDIAATTTLATNLIKQTAEIGMSGVFTTLANATKLAPIMENVTKNLIPMLQQKPNFGLLSEIASTKIGASVLGANAGNLISASLANYKTVLGAVQSAAATVSTVKSQIAQTKQDFKSMKTAFTAVKADWKTTVVGVKKVLSAKALKAASKDAIKMVKAGVAEQAKEVAFGIGITAVASAANFISKKPVVSDEAFMLAAATASPQPSVAVAVAGEIPYYAQA
jgi:hypothetical protein